MAARTRPELADHLEFRRRTLADAAEWMFAALQLHVDGCPACHYQVCMNATHATVRRIRAALLRDRLHPVR